MTGRGSRSATRSRALLREAVASALSQPVASLVTIAMVAGMCLATVLTSGRTAAAEAAALSLIDAAGTRMILVRATEEAGLEAGVVDRVRLLSGIESAVALGPITDSRNALLPRATPVPVRMAYGDLPAPADPGTVYASAAGALTLGLHDGTGPITTANGRDLLVIGTLVVPDHLAGLEPLVVTTGGPSDPVTALVVLADEPATVTDLTTAVGGLLAVDDTSQITIETSPELGAVRAAVAGELATYGRTTVLGILAVAGVLVAANLFGLVQVRRKDFGRRRALGATRGLIVALLLTQVALLGTAGAAVGVSAGLGVLAVTDAPLPNAAFVLAVAVGATLTAILAAAMPALVAARRDPFAELRVP